MNYKELYLKDEAFEIVGCAMRVHRELGNGFLESVYQEALSIELKESNIPYVKEKLLPIYYKDNLLQKKYIADFICHGQIVVELKATESICDEHISQVLNYLKATGNKLGILINFGSKSLQFKRVIR